MFLWDAKNSTHAKLTDLRIDGDRLWQRHMAIAKIGALEGGGNCRLCMTEEDRQARDLFRSWCEEAALDIRIDLAGNIYGIRKGLDDHAPIVLTGSHLDTQPHGGRFDGVSGVLSGLEVIETLNDMGVKTRAPIAVVNWTNEEGVRFAPGLLGSSWFAGALSDNDVLNAVSKDGKRFESEARLRGYLGDMRPNDISVGAYYELHIEQGPILEKEKHQIGVVESIQGLRWMDVSVTGMDAHAGATPMDQRQDTIQACSRILTAINDLGRRHAPDARISVGYIKPHTDGVSTICGHTDFVIDIRHPSEEMLDILANDCRDLCVSEAGKQNCSAVARQRIAVKPVAFDPQNIAKVEAAARSLGYRFRRMPSGALHDASNMATIVPAAMIFIPCKGGLSHNVNESAASEDLEAGCNVLLHAILATAGL